VKKRILIFLLAFLLLGGSVFASAGSQTDPLITRSFIKDSFLPQLRSAFAARTEAGVASAVSSPGLLTLTLSAGQTVVCEVGTELLPRLGTVRAAGADYPVLVDSTTGENVSNGAALSANHLYLVTIAGNGFKADGNNTKVLISGTYTVQ